MSSLSKYFEFLNLLRITLRRRLIAAAVLELAESAVAAAAAFRVCGGPEKLSSLLLSPRYLN